MRVQILQGTTFWPTNCCFVSACSLCPFLYSPPQQRIDIQSAGVVFKKKERGKESPELSWAFKRASEIVSSNSLFLENTVINSGSV